MIFSGCSTGVPLQPTQRSKPVALLVPLQDYLTAKNVANIPYTHVKNMETAGICSGRLLDLQKWVIDGYKKKSFFDTGE